MGAILGAVFFYFSFFPIPHCLSPSLLLRILQFPQQFVFPGLCQKTNFLNLFGEDAPVYCASTGVTDSSLGAET